MSRFDHSLLRDRALILRVNEKAEEFKKDLRAGDEVPDNRGANMEIDYGFQINRRREISAINLNLLTEEQNLAADEEIGIPIPLPPPPPTINTDINIVAHVLTLAHSGVSLLPLNPRPSVQNILTVPPRRIPLVRTSVSHQPTTPLYNPMEENEVEEIPHQSDPPIDQLVNDDEDPGKTKDMELNGDEDPGKTKDMELQLYVDAISLAIRKEWSLAVEAFKKLVEFAKARHKIVNSAVYYIEATRWVQDWDDDFDGARLNMEYKSLKGGEPDFIDQRFKNGAEDREYKELKEEEPDFVDDSFKNRAEDREYKVQKEREPNFIDESFKNRAEDTDLKVLKEEESDFVDDSFKNRAEDKVP